MKLVINVCIRQTAEMYIFLRPDDLRQMKV